MRLEAGLALGDVVVCAADGLVAEDDDDGQVDERHESHQDIAQVPRDLELEERACEDEQRGDGAEEREHPVLHVLVAHEEAEVDLGVVEVTDQRGEGEEEQGNRDEDLRDALAEDRGHRVLHEGSARHATVLADARGENHERGESTDHHGVDEDGEHLDEALLSRVRHGGGGRGVRSGTDTGLVRVEAALDAVHHRRTGEATEDGLEVESATEDRREHRGNVLVVERDDDEADTQVDDRHDGHEQASDVRQATGAAEDRAGHQHREDDADNPRRPLVRPAVMGESVSDVEGGEQVEAAHVGQNEDRREERGKPVLLESHLDVVGRTTVGVVGPLLLVDLRKRRLDEGGRATEGRDDPHPEDGAGAAKRHGRCHTGNVADAHARGRGDHQGAERGNLALLVGRLSHDADRFLKQTKGQRTRANEEVQADANQKGDEQVRVHEA